MKKGNNVFFETFAGEYCEVILDVQIPSSFNIGSEGELHEMKMPLTINGFVMDADDMFIYLSADGESVNQAFPIKELKHIAIVEVKNPLQELLDEIPEPKDKKEYN